MGSNLSSNIINQRNVHPRCCGSLKKLCQMFCPQSYFFWRRKLDSAESHQIIAEPTYLKENVSIDLDKLHYQSICPSKRFGTPLSSIIKETHNVQSPINLGVACCVICDGCDPLQLNRYFGNEGHATIINTGQTVKISLENRPVPFIRGGPLNNDYAFDSLHFHWSDVDNDGTEHTIDGHKYSMECHLVHYNTRYSSVEEAVKYADGLAVLGFFIQAYGDVDSEAFQEIVNGVSNVTNVGAERKIGADCLEWLQLQELQKHYFAYRGSLTTEPYSESVTWIVFRTPVYVSEKQVSAFRTLQGSPNLYRTPTILNNIRPLQTPPNGHKILFARSTRFASKL